MVPLREVADEGLGLGSPRRPSALRRVYGGRREVSLLTETDDYLAAGAAIIRRSRVIREELGPEAESRYRVRETIADPVLFALVYLSKHLTNPETGRITLSEVHLAWAETAAEQWPRQPGPAEDRRAEVAPREMGKSTWWFLILPMWAAAHDHVGFAAAFADTDTQAQTHLATFKAELDSNVILRADFPELVEPKTRGRGTVMADRVSLYHAKSGFVFAAAGMDSSNLGMKVGDRRPDLIILDDIEPHEARYSSDLAKKRLATLREAILPLNIRAHVVMVGTVTMQGSIVHQVVKRSRGDYEHDDPDEPTNWVEEEKIAARHWLPIITLDDGDRVSIWPAKWSLEFLESIEGTRAYMKNYANDPLGADGDYWTLDDFLEAPAEILEAVTHEVISVDPAVTSKKSSDATAISAVGYARTLRKCVLFEARAVRLGPDDVRLKVLEMVEAALERGHAVLVYVEANQGGDLWRKIFHDMPVKVKIYTTGPASKNVRAAEALNHYNRKRVYHVRKARGVRDAEGEMVAFPNAPHDDLVDSTGAGVRYFLTDRQRKVRAGSESVRYA